MDLRGQNMYAFSELVYFPDQTYQIQQFLSDPGESIEIGDEVEIDQPPDFSSTVFQQNIGINPEENSHNVMDYQAGNVEIEAVTTDTGFMDMPSFDDLLDFNHFQFVGNHVSVAYDGKIASSNDLDIEQANGRECNDSQVKLLGVGCSYDGNSNSDKMGNTERGKKRKSHPEDNSDEYEESSEDSEYERRTNEEREKVVSQISIHSSTPKLNPRSSKGRSWKKYRFLIGMRVFVTKTEILKLRTGAVAHFKAVFEDEEYNEENAARMLPEKKKKQAVPNSSSTGDEINDKDFCDYSTTISSKCISVNPEPDHSYSATILTQKESSPTVRDHQYNEATTISGKKEKSKGQKYVFAKVRYQREKTLLMLMDTLFGKKKDIEATTGAWIEFTVDYEDYTFTQNNIKEASSMLRKKRRIHQCFTPIAQSTLALEESHLSNPSQQSKHEIIIKAPKSAYRLNQTKKIVDSHGTTIKVSVVEGSANKVGPCIQFLESDPNTEPDESWNRHRQEPEACDDTHSVGNISVSAPFHSERTHYNNEETGVQSSNPSILPEQMGKLSSRKSTPYETENEDFPSSPTGSGNVGCGDGPLSPVLSPATTESMFVSVSTQSVAVNPNRKDTQDFGTNTEPICGKCFSNQPFSTHSHSPLHSQEIFWIRCSTALCHFIVHASCVGFYVSSPFQLRMLPPYFCENHRIHSHPIEMHMH